MSSEKGYKALAGEIHTNAEFINDAAEAWKNAWLTIREAELPDKALGVIGDAANFVPDFNKASEVAVSALWDGSAALYEAAETLQKTAHNYSKAESETLDAMPPGLSHRPDI